MEILKDELRAFDLTDAEAQILVALSESDIGSVSVSALSRKADVPRTTVYSALLRLKDRGFVRKVHKGHKTIWKLSESSKIEKIVHEGLEHFGIEEGIAEEGYLDSIDAGDVGIRVYKGKRQIMSAYGYILTLSRAERVFAIQGNKSGEKLLKNPNKQYILDFQAKFKKANVIMEGFRGEYVFKLLRKLSIEDLKSQAERMLISTIINDNFMDFGLDVVVMKDLVLIINVEKEIVMAIRNKAVVEMIHSFCLLFQEYGRQINYNREVWKIIEEKGKK